MANILSIERILNQVNPDVTVFQALDFASDALSGSIMLGEQFDEEFAEVIREVYGRIGIHLNCSLETFAVLHELGHIETLGHLHEDDLKEALNMYLIAKTGLEEAETDFDQFYQYTQLEIEQLANDWAVDFMQAHPSIVADLDRIMVQYYKSFDSTDAIAGILSKALSLN